MVPLVLPPAISEQLRTSHWRVLVTGASGWLGQAALELLADALGENWRKRVFAFGSRPCNWVLRDGTEVDQRPLFELPSLPPQPSLLLHFAYLTREKTAHMPAEDYIAANRGLSRLAVEGGAAVGVERAFATSSGAVHAALAAPESTDPSLLYGKLKLEDEALLHVFAHATPGRRAFVARLFNLSGPYINKLDSYALASFIQQARKGHIDIRASHPVIRSYTSAANLLGVAFGQLLSEDAESFTCAETTGDCEVEIGDLAKAVRAVVAPSASIQREKLTATTMDRYVGDGRLYRQLVVAHGMAEHTLPQQIADTAEYLAQAATTPP